MNDHDTDPPGTPGDPFDLLGLEPGFRVDAIALRRAWLERSARLHPDRPGAPADAAVRRPLLPVDAQPGEVVEEVGGRHGELLRAGIITPGRREARRTSCASASRSASRLLAEA